MKNATQAYRDVEVNSEVASASNHRLIQLLMEKCLEKMTEAENSITNNDVITRCKAISKVMDILGYLRACLSFKDEATTEMSNLLDSIYDFLERNMLMANMKNDVEYIQQCKRILKNVKSGWDSISTK